MTVKPLCVEFCYCAVKSVLSTTLNTEVWGPGGFLWTHVMKTVEAVKSANSCMEMQSDSPKCQWVWEPLSVQTFVLRFGWEQKGSLLSVFHFFPNSYFNLMKYLWTGGSGLKWNKTVEDCFRELISVVMFINSYSPSYQFLPSIPNIRLREAVLLIEIMGWADSKIAEAWYA